MASTEIPPQCEFLLRLLKESSRAFAKEFEQMMQEAGVPFNPATVSFEVDVYFTFWLSCSLLNLNHDRQVCEDMCSLCELALSKIHAKTLDNNDLAEVIAARVQEEALRLVQELPSVLVCFEADVDYCHRGRLAEAVSSEGAMSVVHLG